MMLPEDEWDGSCTEPSASPLLSWEEAWESEFARASWPRKLAEAWHPEGTPQLKLVLAFVGRALERGHVCLSLSELCSRSFWGWTRLSFARSGLSWPSVVELATELAGLACVDACSQIADRATGLELRTGHAAVRSAAGRLLSAPLLAHPVRERREQAPFVLDAEGRLYLERWAEAEAQVAYRLLALAQQPGLQLPSAEQSNLLRRYFPEGTEGSAQARAGELSLHSKVLVVTGGPGTGKTTTAAKILALFLETAKEGGARVALCAPTGKAAARLSESMQAAVSGLGLSAELQACLPERALTLHSLLEYRPSSLASFHRGPESPLPYDFVLLDEVSMVDLLLMRQLLCSLAPGTRLVLLGDEDQLEAVEAGCVLAELAEYAGSAQTGGLGFVRLDKSFRFQEGGGIFALATAIRAGDGPAALECLRSRPGLRWIELPSELKGRPDWAQRLGTEVLGHWADFYRSQSVEAGLQALGEYRILCAHRRGSFGAAEFNAWVSRALAQAGDRSRCGEASGTLRRVCSPLMVTQNDRRLGVQNGELGIWFHSEGSSNWGEVHLPAAPGLAARVFSPAELSGAELAWAMTIHKSQGSEFDEVLCVLPGPSSPLLTRELFYTAVTRARSRVTLVASAESVLRACRTRQQRQSGLHRRLQEAELLLQRKPSGPSPA